MDAEEEGLEHTLLLVREVNVYKVPPHSTSGGYKCAEWLVSSKIWSGRLRVVSVKDVCEIRLEDPTSGELFATCRVKAGQRDASVQNAVDSSRYFVLKIDDGRGRHAFIGLGFNERNEAFDFNVALSDHEKHVLHEKSRPPEAPVVVGTERGGQVPHQPSADFKLKAGETIRISMKPMASGAAEKKLGMGLGGPSTGGFGGGVLRPIAPPPGGGGGIRLAPPPGGGSGVRLGPPPSAASPGVPAPALTSAPAPSPYNTPTAVAYPAPVPAPGSSQTSSPATGWTAF